MSEVRPAPALQRLARSVPGPPRSALAQLLLLLCEQLGLELAFAATLGADGTRTLRVAVTASGGPVPGVEGRTEPLDETWCGRVVEQGVLLVPDVAQEPELQVLRSTAAFGIVSHAGVVVLDGNRVIGTLCAVGPAPQAFRASDVPVLRALADAAAPWLLELDRSAGTSIPAPRTATDLQGLAEVLFRADDLETLSRPLLDALHELTGLGSTYLTVIHEDRDVQEIRYSTNTRPGLVLPEGLEVPWGDTLCKRALDEGRPSTTAVSQVWGDSQAAAELGIEVYLSVPITLSDGTLYGTLCAADRVAAERVEDHLPTMQLFGRLIAAEVERGRAVAAATALADRAVRLAETDPLTGCSSRRVVEPWLASTLAGLPDEHVLLVAFVDVDDFKSVNDRLGHAGGDAVLVEVATRLQLASRPGDLVARMGGDEFVVGAVVPRSAAGAMEARIRATADVALRVEGGPLRVRTSVGVAVSDGPDASALLAAADAAMYAVKRAARDAPEGGRQAPLPSAGR
ncbi:MAG: diguanylate cyclase [Mycobacteriales bacterium]|nr:diguanylate cyclase [Mycobacteriales bacterium]